MGYHVDDTGTDRGCFDRSGDPSDLPESGSSAHAVWRGGASGHVLRSSRAGPGDTFPDGEGYFPDFSGYGHFSECAYSDSEWNHIVFRGDLRWKF